MKKMMTRVGILLLTLCLLCPALIALASCGGEKPSQSNETTETTTGGSDPGKQPIVKIDYHDYLPKATYGFEEVTVLTDRPSAIFIEEDDIASTFEQTVYQRLVNVETKYEVFLNLKQVTYPPRENFHALCSESLAGGTAYDIVLEDYYYGLEAAGYYLNMMDYSNILHFENPYWMSGWNDSATIGGKLFSALGSITMNAYANAVVTFFNGLLAEDVGIERDYGENLYSMVDSGEWTLERMEEIMKRYSLDKSGDGTFGFEDNYGLGYNLWSGRALLVSCGLQMVEQDSDGLINFIDTSEKNVEIFNQVYHFLISDVCYYGGGAGSVESNQGDRNLFVQNRALFELNQLGAASVFYAGLDKVGVLPLPKLDASQADYISTIMGARPVAIMKNARDPEMSATLIEALSIYGYEDIRPQYYESIKIRYQSDEEAAGIIDSIMDRIWIDFTFVNDGYFSGMSSIPFYLIEEKNRNYVSQMNSRCANKEAWLKNLYKAYGVEVGE